jgi:hypothetical protein
MEFRQDENGDINAALNVSDVLLANEHPPLDDLAWRGYFRWHSQPGFCLAAERFLEGLSVILTGREWNRLSPSAHRRAGVLFMAGLAYLGWMSYPGRQGTPWERQPVVQACYPDWPEASSPAANLARPNEETLCRILKLYGRLFEETRGRKSLGESEEDSNFYRVDRRPGLLSLYAHPVPLPFFQRVRRALARLRTFVGEFSLDECCSITSVFHRVQWDKAATNSFEHLVDSMNGKQKQDGNLVARVCFFTGLENWRRNYG